jgi:plastocyanin
MSRLVHRPITVTTDERGDPVTFTDGNQTHHIAHVIDAWWESGEWIKNEPHHHVFRVLTTDNYVYDIELVGDQWFIYRVWD